MMKLINRFFLFSILFFSFFTLLGCQEVIYDNIRKEVSLEDGTVAGNIRSIIRFTSNGTEYFYISNGSSIYRKNIDVKQKYGGWEEDDSKNPSDYIISIAADSNYLYALAATWEENTTKGQNRWNGRAIYCSKDGGKTWASVKGARFRTPPTASYSDFDKVVLFCTNSISQSNRKAYYNYDGKVFELNGTTATEVTRNSKNASTSPTKETYSCASLSGTVYFFDYYAACTNETSVGGDETVYYYADGRTLYWDGAVKGSLKAGDDIYSLATTKDFILVGTESGIEHYAINENGSISASSKDFSTNAAAIMTGSYEVNAIAVVKPELNETSGTIYASIDFEGRNQQFDHICIWAYYPERGNWNRD